MQLKPQDKKNIFISGVFIIFLSALSAVSIFMIGNESSMFSSKMHIHTYVSNVNNLKSGAAVQLKGIKIGTVKSIQFTDYNKIKITIAINTEYQQWIRTDSYISFSTQGVLGDKFLEILGGTEKGRAISDNQFLISQEKGGLDQFINKGEDILTTANRVLKKIDAILGPVDDSRVENILVNVEKLSRNISSITRSMDPDDLGEAVRNLSSATEAFSNLSRRIDEGPGTLHSLIYDPSVHEDLKSLLGGSKRSSILKFFIRESIANSEN